MNRRDEFTDLTKRDLARNVRFRCVRPGCARSTHGPSLTARESINIGNAAHASAAAQNGPRFDATLTAAQRRAYRNGAWLCAGCATLVDQDPDSYPIDMLQDWQRRAEQLAREELHGTFLGATISQAEISQRLSDFLPFVNKAARFRLPGIMSQVFIPHEVVVALREVVKECSGYYWNPAHRFHSIHQTTVALQDRLVGALAKISERVSSDFAWKRDSYGYTLKADVFGHPLPKEQQEACEEEFHKLKEAYREYLVCEELLVEYMKGIRR